MNDGKAFQKIVMMMKWMRILPATLLMGSFQLSSPSPNYTKLLLLYVFFESLVMMMKWQRMSLADDRLVILLSSIFPLMMDNHSFVEVQRGRVSLLLER